MPDADPDKIIIEGNFLHFTLSDACVAARKHAAELEVTPSEGLRYPDGKSVVPLKMYFYNERIVEITHLRGRSTVSVRTRLNALDLCYPFESSTSSRFSLRLVEPEQPVVEWHSQHFVMSLAQFADEMRGVAAVGAVQIFQRSPALVVEPGGLLSDLPVSDEEEHAFLQYALPLIEQGMKFTVGQLSEHSGLSITCCTLYINKLVGHGIIVEDGKDAPAYGGTVGKGGKKFPVRAFQPARR